MRGCQRWPHPIFFQVKATREKPAQRFEAALEGKLRRFFQSQIKPISEAIARRQGTLPEEYWSELQDKLQAIIEPWLLTVTQAGMEEGARLLEPEHKAAVRVSWDLINRDAQQQARTYTFELVRGITNNTRERLQTVVNQWIESGNAFPNLVGRIRPIIPDLEKVTATALQPERRAKLIAATEATRAYAEGNRRVWEAEGVWGREWRAARDELVCPICGAFHKTRAAFGKQFEATVKGKLIQLDGPPAHPGCRCSVFPVVRPEGVSREPIRKPTPPPKQTIRFPREFESLREVRSLGGSTGAMLMEDPETGRQYVAKRGRSPEHLREEVSADTAYQALGVNVPLFNVYDTKSGPVKISEYIDGETLADVYKRGNKAQIEAVRGQLQQDFAADALLGNWDVIGMENDNILVDGDGKVWRIDNGGALRKRAQGGAKGTAWNAYPTELWTLRDRNINERSASIFGDMDYQDIVNQMDAVVKKQDAVIKAVTDPQLQADIAGRLDQMAYLVDTSKKLTPDNWGYGYQDGFSRNLIQLRQSGVTTQLPQSLMPKKKRTSNIFSKFDPGKVYDENGKLFDSLRGYGARVPKTFNEYVQRNGGNNYLLSGWMQGQAGSSWSEQSQAFKYYIATRARGVQPDSFYWRDGVNQAKSAYDRVVAQYGQDVFEKSFQAYHAFTYELLQKTDFPGKNSDGTVSLWRTENASVMKGYGLNKGDRATIKRGALESFSVFNPITVFGNEVTLQRVPFHRIFGTYFMERFPGYGGGAFLGDNENEFVVIPDGIELEYVQ